MTNKYNFDDIFRQISCRLPHNLSQSDLQSNSLSVILYVNLYHILNLTSNLLTVTASHKPCNDLFCEYFTSSNYTIDSRRPCKYYTIDTAIYFLSTLIFKSEVLIVNYFYIMLPRFCSLHILSHLCKFWTVEVILEHSVARLKMRYLHYSCNLRGFYSNFINNKSTDCVRVYFLVFFFILSERLENVAENKRNEKIRACTSRHRDSLFIGCLSRIRKLFQFERNSFFINIERKSGRGRKRKINKYGH